MSEQTGLDLVVAGSFQYVNKLGVGVKASLSKIRHGFLYGTVEKMSTFSISLYVLGSSYFVQGSGGEKVGRHNDEFGGGHRGAEVEVRNVS